MNNLLQLNWKEVEFVALDLETSGKYPIQADICEIGALKYKNGEITDSFQTLVKPRELMGEEVIKIHNITNEMVSDAPSISDVIVRLHSFIGEGVVVAHHAPFDLGFLAVDFESAKLSLPPSPVVCSSLLSRSVIIESSNHRLQTLVSFLNIEVGQAHRALDDARMCMDVVFHCIHRMGNPKLSDLFDKQGGEIKWSSYSLEYFKEHDDWFLLVDAAKYQQPIDLVYKGGSRPGQARTVVPIGIVRNPNGDFLVATEAGQKIPKRYYLNKLGKICRPN